MEASTPSLLSLPEEILVKILSEIPLDQLLHSVSRTCKTLYFIIEENNVLWKEIDINVDHVINKDTLSRILKHSREFRTCSFAFSTIACEIYDIDFMFTTNLCNSKNLYCLDISKCVLSTLCFLKYMPNLKTLNVSECPNLVDSDFRVISLCTDLDHLLVSYTHISATTAVEICSGLNLLLLDLSGTILSIEQCDTIAKPCMLHLQVSFNTGESEQEIELLRLRHRDCLIQTAV